ncbi:unnamed protein product [Effrenium voratum]|uniref:Uncharacterized protein n=1 Tax=Effrenium voratum TaxID=2562239 RepID=A0AA36IY55_9DINO|nr:unnamed protein product [Effrenium voratum]
MTPCRTGSSVSLDYTATPPTQAKREQPAEAEPAKKARSRATACKSGPETRGPTNMPQEELSPAQPKHLDFAAEAPKPKPRPLLQQESPRVQALYASAAKSWAAILAQHPAKTELSDTMTHHRAGPCPSTALSSPPLAKTAPPVSALNVRVTPSKATPCPSPAPSKREVEPLPIQASARPTAKARHTLAPKPSITPSSHKQEISQQSEESPPESSQSEGALPDPAEEDFGSDFLTLQELDAADAAARTPMKMALANTTTPARAKAAPTATPTMPASPSQATPSASHSPASEPASTEVQPAEATPATRPSPKVSFQSAVAKAEKAAAPPPNAAAPRQPILRTTAPASGALALIPDVQPIEPKSNQERQQHYAVFKRQVSGETVSVTVQEDLRLAWAEAVRTNSRSAKTALFNLWCRGGGNFGSPLGTKLLE